MSEGPWWSTPFLCAEARAYLERPDEKSLVLYIDDLYRWNHCWSWEFLISLLNPTTLIAGGPMICKPYQAFQVQIIKIKGRWLQCQWGTNKITCFRQCQKALLLKAEAQFNSLALRRKETAWIGLLCSFPTWHDKPVGAVMSSGFVWCWFLLDDPW